MGGGRAAVVVMGARWGIGGIGSAGGIENVGGIEGVGVLRALGASGTSGTSGALGWSGVCPAGMVSGVFCAQTSLNIDLHPRTEYRGGSGGLL